MVEENRLERSSEEDRKVLLRHLQPTNTPMKLRDEYRRSEGRVGPRSSRAVSWVDRGGRGRVGSVLQRRREGG